MKRTVRRKGRISWDQWHRVLMMQSLQMMVMSGVVRRADLDPPPIACDSAAGRHDGQDGDDAPADQMAEPGWLAKIFFSREHFLRRYHHGL